LQYPFNDPFARPFRDPLRDLTTFEAPRVQLRPELLPQPSTRIKDCRCPKPKPKRKKQPRTVCYRGSYRERAKGLIKRRRERIPC
jgi:hypothetical protein